MIQALTNHKGHLTSKNEDSKTAMVLGTLLHLPANWLWSILFPYYSPNCQDVTQEIFIADYEFWPKWSSKGIPNCQNTKFIEPDLFIRFGFRSKAHGHLGFPTEYNCPSDPSYFDVIIEAKVNITNPQDSDQWEREIQAYYNHYRNEEVNLSHTVLIALDGNFDMNPVPSSKKGYRGVPVIKTSWKELKYRLEQLLKDTHLDNEYGFTHIILKDTIESLTYFGETSTKWFDDININYYLNLEEY